MTDKYEAHITFTYDSQSILIDNIKELEDADWKFSKIDGDPLLGEGLKCYLTNHSDDYDELYFGAVWTAGWCESLDCDVLRIKIEQTLFDIVLEDESD